MMYFKRRTYVKYVIPKVYLVKKNSLIFLFFDKVNDN